MESIYAPIIDLANPFYCPNICASDFLSSISFNRLNLSGFSFHARLILSLQDIDSAKSICTNQIKPNSKEKLVFTKNLATQEAYDDKSPKAPEKLLVKRKIQDSSLLEDPIFCGRTPKRARSISESVSSFVLSSKADRLHLTPALNSTNQERTNFSSSDRKLSSNKSGTFGALHALSDGGLMADCRETIQLLEGDEFYTISVLFETDLNDLKAYDFIFKEELFGPRIGPDTPRSISTLVKYLASVMPGYRLQQKLADAGITSHQGLIDFFGSRGQMNAEILNVFRSSKINKVDMSQSLHEENGLNIAGRETLLVFKLPNSFLSLEEIRFSGSPLQDHDLTVLQHLPRLQTLFMDNTGIGNEAVMHLVALKHTLKTLDIAVNYRINDDCIPSLQLLAKLQRLYMKATGVSIDGIRRLSELLAHTGRKVTIEIPLGCLEYLQNLGAQYAIQIDPPLINDASLCGDLSPEALKRNLLSHANFNRQISVTGTRAEMVDRLSQLLDIRKKDMMARDLIFPSDAGNSCDTSLLASLKFL